MHRDGMTVTPGSSNGVLITTETETFRLDPGKTLGGDVNVVSHAHSDHLPRSGTEMQIVASRETIELARMRTGKKYTGIRHGSVRLLDAGHVPGSKMVMVRDELSYLYTGDFCTRKKVYLNRARAVRTDVLVTETTYGHPRYRFPDPVELAGVIRDWAADTLSRGHSIIFSAYPLGKAQELQVILRGMPVYADEPVERHNRILQGPKDEPLAAPLARIGTDPSIVITSGRGIMPTLPAAIRRNAMTATASGWCLDGGFRGRMGYDEAFPLSDHCDYYDLLDFVKGCSPSLVYTVHGFDSEFAASIRKELGIEAKPLRQKKEKQKKLDSF